VTAQKPSQSPERDNAGGRILVPVGKEEDMARGLRRETGLEGRRSGWLAWGLLLLPAMAVAQEQAPRRSSGRGFVFGGSLGGGQLSFPGGGDRALAIGPVVEHQTFAVWGTSTTTDVRDAMVVRAGEDVPGAERVVPLPAHEGAGSLSMSGGYAFNRRVAVLLDVEVSGGLGASDFNHAVGSFAVRYWPTYRVWAEAGPAFGDLGYGMENSTVRSGAITGDGIHGAVGVALVRKPKWSLDVQARFSTIWYDGFRATTAGIAFGASRLPL
jgi:hypothetical protein